MEEEKKEEKIPDAVEEAVKEVEAMGEEISPIDEAKRILAENKNLLMMMTAERKRIEKATAEALINGRSYAGQTQPKAETEDEKWAREAKERYAGTGMCPA